MLFSTLVTTTLLSLTSAAPLAEISKRWPTDDGTSLRPSVISIYHGQNGAIDYNTPHGEVSRAQWNGKDNSTLVTFDLTSRTPPAGATCSFKFFIDPADTAAKATGFIDIFKSLAPAPVGGSPGWGPPGNQRDTNLGRFQPQVGGYATVVSDVGPNQLNGFPCPTSSDYHVKNGLVGYEIVPAGDQVRVEWTAALSGLYLDW